MEIQDIRNIIEVDRIFKSFNTIGNLLLQERHDNIENTFYLLTQLTQRIDKLETKIDNIYQLLTSQLDYIHEELNNTIVEEKLSL